MIRNHFLCNFDKKSLYLPHLLEGSHAQKTMTTNRYPQVFEMKCCYNIEAVRFQQNFILFCFAFLEARYLPLFTIRRVRN